MPLTGHGVIIDTTLLKNWLNERWFVYVFRFIGILCSLASSRTNYLRFDISQNPFVWIVQLYTLSQEIRSLLEGLWALQSASIDHGHCFRCANGALCLIRFNQICFAGLSGCWRTLSARGLMRDIIFSAQQPPDLTTLRTSSWLSSSPWPESL